MNLRIWGLSACVLLCAAVALRGDRVVLKGGQTVTGEVLKSDDKVVVVDLGATVLTLPRSEVARIEQTDGATTRPDSAATTQPDEHRGPEWQLYRTAVLQPGSIERLAAAHGEGVVMVSTPGGQGSGFVINPDGYMITNYHVISGETRIKVTAFRRTETGFENRHFNKVRIIAINPFVDLALLKIEDADGPLKFVYLGDQEDVQVGQDCFAIGNPLGLTRTVSQGIVSSKNRNFEGRLYIQTTTDINPGNSGGPLFNRKGEVIGVTSMGYLYLGGLNFAIPVDVVQRFILNRDAFAYDEDNPNTGYRYIQPAGRTSDAQPPAGRLPTVKDIQ